MRRGVAAGVVLAVLAVSPALARKVADPTNALGATLSTYSVSVADGTYSWAGTTAFSFGHAGTVDGAGNVTIPQAALTFPNVPVGDIEGDVSTPCGNEHYKLTNVSISLLADGPATGTIDPLSGQATLSLSAHATAAFNGAVSGCYSQTWSPPNCRIGDASSPVSIALSTSGPGGHPYSDADGSLTLAGDQFALPATQGCADGLTFGSYVEPYINSSIGLPSPAGHNVLVLGGVLDPVLHRAVRAQLAASPTALDASASTAVAGIATYAFDTDGDGTFDTTTASPTAAAAFPGPGTYTARVRVTDTEGDSDITSTVVTVPAPPPDTSSPSDTSAPASSTPAPAPASSPAGVSGSGDATTLLGFSSVVGLPAHCAGRALTWRVSLPAGQRIRSLRAFIGRRRLRIVRHGNRFTVRRLPRRGFRLRIVLVTRSGRVISGTRRFATCA